jgi:hypothetical protein
MGMIRCEYCHNEVEARDFPAHRAKHVKLCADGQQMDYATLPPEEREEGSLEGVPRVYVHLRCGAGTVMQESIIRSYLKDPFMYDDLNYCTGCKANVPDQECEWQETGENLHSYMEGLRAQHCPKQPGYLRRILNGILKLFR